MAQSFTSHLNYDVFLSFRGEDTRYTFTGNLNDAFCKRGIETFFDDQKLKPGDELSPSLLKAIEESRMFVIVLSENYASSTWCLDELVMILQCAVQNNRRVWPIFYKVDPSEIRHQRNSYGDAMTKYEEMFGKDSERVRNWRSALTKVANLKGDHFRITGYEYESKFIDDIVKEVSITLPPKCLHVEKHVVGLKPHLKKVISLLDISSQSTVCMLGIHGIGGIGKTTLAKVLYNSIVDQFEYASFLTDERGTSNKYKRLVNLQETLLSKMLGGQNIKLRNVDEGAFRIKNMLHNRRVLLVLDDVDCREQLKKLVGECNWFGSGSKIIVTTRDKHLLLAHGVEKTYEMKELNHHEARQLFCWKAFHNSYPPERFVDFSNKIVNYAGGHPLALEVIGSNLFGKDLDACEDALEQYKRIPNEDIQRILRKSYDNLEENQKHIFLDIAFFFKGWSSEYVEKILHACGFGPKYHIGVLVDKSLITIENDLIQMHDLIQDMGKEVVRKAAPKEPGRRSRLWLDKEIVNVLEENSGTYEIEGIVLQSPQQKIQWKGTAFKKMKNLRILIIQDAYFSVGPKYLPNSLRVLVWNQCPSTSLPSNFDLKNLVVFEMPYSSLKLEKSFENSKYLSVMNLSYCQSITEIPDMSGVLALKTLNFSHCENLVKVHDSIGFLPKVTELDLESCEKLTSLPSAMQMESLKHLNIACCTSLEHFPNISGKMDCLSYISAEDTAIKELPDSIGNLISLVRLTVSRSNLVYIPESIKRLSKLNILQINGCKNIQEIYEIPSNLRNIYANGCTSLTPQSCRVLQSQAIKGIPTLYIEMLGAQIPDWFHHCCKGRVLSFWAHQKLPHAVFAFIYRYENEQQPDFRVQLFINNFEVDGNVQHFISFNKQIRGCHMSLQDLNQFVGGRERIKGLKGYLLPEWNYIKIKVTTTNSTIDECGIYVYKQGTRMEDVRFECPYPNQLTELVLRNALKRGATLHQENEPSKKLQRKHKPKDYRGKGVLSTSLLRLLPHMEPKPPCAGGAAEPTMHQSPGNNPNYAQVPKPPPSSTPSQPSSISGNPPASSSLKRKAPHGPSNKGKAHASSSDKGKGPAAPKDKGKAPSNPLGKKGKATSASGKKRKASSRKPDANKTAGIETRKRSVAWQHFKKVPEDEVSEPTTKCIHCGHRFLCSSKEHGTSNLLAHIKKCPKYAHTLNTDPKQKVLDFEGKHLAGSISHAVDLKDCRKSIALFVICDVQPFKVVEGFGFKNMCKRLCPQLDVPSRRTIARDCYKIYLEEKDRLKVLLKSDCVRVCLTTDCWTSLQNLNYMALTAHFIDDDWNYQKRILNFCQVPNHKGETIGKTIEACLNDWGLKRVFTVTVDNASSNDVAISYLKKKVKNWNGLVLNGEFMHMRCCAHILNLVVNEGLKDYHESICAIRHAVRYVRSLPSRLAKFKKAMEAENLTCKGLVCLDVATRWNSTFKMLESAVKFQKAFERLEEDDRDYLLYFQESERRGSPPKVEDWDNARVFSKFLKLFYDVTLAISGSLNITANSVYTHISLVQSELKKWTATENCDSLLYFMATEMKIKCDKYWGLIDNMNPIIFVANVLDPRLKLAYIEWTFQELYGETLATLMVGRVKASLAAMYDWYALEYGKPRESGLGKESCQGDSSSQRQPTLESHAQKARNAAFLAHLKKKDTIEATNELERYLSEPCANEEHEKCDPLTWWKTHASRFDVLSRLARDVLAVPVSTVASESAFSTGGRVLDAFRSSLSPKTVEALICTQNWLKPTKIEFQCPEEPDDPSVYEEIEQELAAAYEGGNSEPGTSTTRRGGENMESPQPMAED